jgi:hypothetical protein
MELRRQKIGADVLETAQRLDAAGKLTPLRRQLLGLEQLYSERRTSPTRNAAGEWESRVALEER